MATLEDRVKALETEINALHAWVGRHLIEDHHMQLMTRGRGEDRRIQTRHEPQK